MANLRAQFENELRQKLEQKSSAHTSEETILLRTFRYFDLDQSETVSLEEWTKAIEKVGVVTVNPEVLEQVFHSYDVDGNGTLDYKEFIAGVFGDQSATAKRLSPHKALAPSERQQSEEVLENIRTKLAARGTRGILGLARQFKIMDDDNSKSLSLPEFTKAMHDYRVDLTDPQLQLVFNAVDRNRSGTIDYDEFLRAVRGPMNSFRKGLVAKAFDKLDRDGSGVLDITDVKQVYNARGHPDVKSGKKTEEDILGEFLETFETHHNILGGNDREVTREEFEEYYNNVSASVDNDQYFELMMNNAWKLNEAPAYTQNKAWRSDEEGGAFGAAPRSVENRRRGNEGVTDVHRTSNIMLKQAGPAKLRGAPATRSEEVRAAPPPPSAPMRGGNVEILLEKFRNKLAARGTRGILGLQRSFKIMDDDNSKDLSLVEFRKACNDYRLDMSPEDIDMLFRAFDRDRSGSVDYDELIRGIRGPMNSFRRSLVAQAWNKLNKDGNDIIDMEDIRGVYDPRNHPDVRSGKKTPDEVLNEFLETFELHHNISDRSQMDHRVTKEEFDEYYNTISASVDDDRYFELMITNAWKLKGEQPKREAWAAAVGGREPRGGRTSTAPFGTSEEKTDFSTSLRPAQPQVDLLKAAQEMQPAGTSTWPGQTKVQAAAQGGRQGSRSDAELLEVFRERLLARGARGIIGLQRQFKIMDDNDNKRLELSEFVKAIRDFRVDVSDQEATALFNYMDANHDQSIDYEELIHRVRGPMNDTRKALVRRAFTKLDRNRNGIVELEDIKGVYNAASHPDVRSGKKTEDEVLGEFLDTFEMHHSVFVGGTGRDQRVSEDEFMEYYNHISASIGNSHVDDDRYFDLMMTNAWNFNNQTYAKGWAADDTAPAQKKRFL